MVTARGWAPPTPHSCQPSTTRVASPRGVVGIERQIMLDKVTKQKLVVIGNGMAGIRTVEEMLARAPGSLRDHRVRRRAPRQLQPHHAVAGPGRREALRRHRASTRRAGTTTTASSSSPASGRRDRPATREVRRRGGHRVAYDKLLLATGSNPIMLPLPGRGPAGRGRLPRHRRRRGDGDGLPSRHPRGGDRRRPAGAGGGLRPDARGMAVTVVHLMPTLMERQLDPVAGELLRARPGRARHGVLTDGQTRGNPRRRARSRGVSWPTAVSCRPIWW